MISNECPVWNYSNKFPDDTALIKGELGISYKDLSNRIDAAVLSLKGKGVKPGMKVGIISENSIQYIILIFALLRMGSLAVPINFRFRYPEIEEIISGIGIDLMISGIFTTELASSVIKNFDPEDVDTDKISDSRYRETEFIAKGGTIILTSGSTGVPKGVLISAENHFFSAAGSNLNIDLKTGDKWLLTLPLYHVGGMAILFRAFLAGATISLPYGKGKSICEEIEDGCITHVSMVSTQLVEYVSCLEGLNKTVPLVLKVILAGGSYIPEALILRALSLNVPVYKTYGLTEMSSQVTTTDKKVSRKSLSTSGSLLKYRDLLIGTGNEILVRGKTLSRGYIFEGKFIPIKTDEDGWFNTGDIGNIGESGDLFLSGRKDNMFISGGENVFPEEIESELLKIDNIVEAVIVSIEDEKYGNRPVAFISTGGKKISRNEIVKSLKIRLPGFKVPDRFYYLDSINGQVKRRRPFLRELAKLGKGLKLISD
ncbi:MAG: o-succinylbenzoate--CoA ligase [Candidatus Aminicenantes bacterium]|nr:o-succinylbenzoate--CoA ligase [Candidatus Aminicenantes bacterium]